MFLLNRYTVVYNPFGCLLFLRKDKMILPLDGKLTKTFHQYVTIYVIDSKISPSWVSKKEECGSLTSMNLSNRLFARSRGRWLSNGITWYKSVYFIRRIIFYLSNSSFTRNRERLFSNGITNPFILYDELILLVELFVYKKSPKTIM